MAKGIFAFENSVLLLLLFLTVVDVDAYLRIPKVFDVTKYGARADEKFDNSEVFLNTWKDACAYDGMSRMLIPGGIYFVRSATFVGLCNGSMAFILKGTLKAPTDNFFTDTWIGFRYVDDLTVEGNGHLDGQGSVAWKYNDCQTNTNCKSLPVTMRFDFVTNSRIHNIRSLNSKNTHFSIFASYNLNISHIRITAPNESPNTDGIRIGYSKKIQISSSVIGTGDDCIAMIAGSQDIDISNVACGPGHGISIGSLAGSQQTRDYVTRITVKNCSFTDTQNGVRIKTWAPSSYGLASGITFQDISMTNVRNPIVIDQNYCPRYTGCGFESNSRVQIQDVTYNNIWGVSNTAVAVNLKCSEAFPCKNVKLININLAYGKGGSATSLCSNVIGASYGKQNPSGCIRQIKY